MLAYQQHAQSFLTARNDPEGFPKNFDDFAPWDRNCIDPQVRTPELGQNSGGPYLRAYAVSVPWRNIIKIFLGSFLGHS